MRTDTKQFRQFRQRCIELREAGYGDYAIGRYLGYSERTIEWVLQPRDHRMLTTRERLRQLQKRG